MIRTVLDANVIVSAVLTPAGIPAQILDAWRGERFALLVSPAILEEIGRVLKYPKIARLHRWLARGWRSSSPNSVTSGS